MKMSAESGLGIRWTDPKNAAITLVGFFSLALISTIILIIPNLIVKTVLMDSSYNARLLVTVLITFGIAFIYLLIIGNYLAGHNDFMNIVRAKKDVSSLFEKFIIALWILGVPTLSILLSSLARKKLGIVESYSSLSTIVPLSLGSLTIWALLAYLKVRSGNAHQRMKTSGN